MVGYDGEAEASASSTSSDIDEVGVLESRYRQRRGACEDGETGSPVSENGVFCQPLFER